MFKFWSEVPSQQVREVFADVLTAGWVAFWSIFAWNLYLFLAQFAEAGLDAVNLGPGATRHAHRADEQVEVGELRRTYEALRLFASGRGTF